MIENLNDFLSFATLVLILIGCIYYAFSIFSIHHTKKIELMEDEYYNFSDDSDEEDGYE